MIDGVRTVTDPDGSVRHVLSDLAKILGMKNASVLVRSLPWEPHRLRLVQTNRGLQSLTTATSEEFTSLLRRSRKPKAIEICEELGLYESRDYIKETDTIHCIVKALKHLNPEIQKSCGPYRVDLYFPTLDVVVECDEKGHTQSNYKADQARQRFIESELGCVFVRYNPDDRDFDIFKVINQILTAGRDSGNM